MRTQIAKNGEDMKGKFGRILGDFDVYDAQTDAVRPVTKILIDEGHAVSLFWWIKRRDSREAYAQQTKIN